MELSELTDLERQLLSELYLYEMDSAGEPMPTADLLGVLETDASSLRMAFRKLALKGLLFGQQVSVRGKLLVEDSGLIPTEKWNEIQAYRQVLAVTLVEILTADPSLEGANIELLMRYLPPKPGMLEFNLDVMADRGFLQVLRGNRIGLGPRLRSVVSR